VKEMIKAGMTAAASMIMRCLSVCGVRVETYVYFENWRRPIGCTCIGCKLWHSVQAGETTVEALGQSALKCRNRFLAWKAKAPISARWNMGMACLWVILLLTAFVNLTATIGVAAIVTTVGKNDLLTQYFKGAAYTAAWFVALVDGGAAPTYNAADTMASHAGWTENVGYSNATRVTWTGGTAVAGQIDNTASPAAFNINATGTIAGQFMTTVNTKSGTTGILYSESNFTQGNRSVVNGDTLNCTAIETAA